MSFSPQSVGVLINVLLSAKRGEGGRRPDEGKDRRCSTDWHYGFGRAFSCASMVESRAAQGVRDRLSRGTQRGEQAADQTDAQRPFQPGPQ